MNDAKLSVSTRELHFLIEQPGPGPESGRFVELEDEMGESVNVGYWEEREDYWHLIILDPRALLAEVERLSNRIMCMNGMGGHYAEKEAHKENAQLRERVEELEYKVQRNLQVMEAMSKR